MRIRPERPEDIAAIAAVTSAAFIGHPHSDQTESLIIDRLRRAQVLTISLVAEDEERIVGHVGFSPVALSGGETGWYGLGPLSVAPDLQGRGIGSMLVRQGLEALKQIGASGCVLVGEPDYYSRFGFEAGTALHIEDVPPEYFLVLHLRGAIPSGIVSFHRGFYGE